MESKGAELETETTNQTKQLDDKEANEVGMFEYLTNVVQERDLEIADLKSEHDQVCMSYISAASPL